MVNMAKTIPASINVITDAQPYTAASMTVVLLNISNESKQGNRIY